MDLKEVKELFEKEFKEFKDLLETQSKEITELGETKTETAQKIEKAEKRIEEVNSLMVDAQKKAEDENKGLLERLTEAEKKLGRVGMDFGAGSDIKSIGEQFTQSDAYKNMIAIKSLSSAPFEVKDLFAFEKKQISSEITGGNLVQPFRVPEIIMPPERPLRIRDLLNVRPTTSNAIEYVEETGFTNQAAPVKEGGKTDEYKKPESALTFKLETATVRTIAHWIPITRQTLADVTQMRAYIDGRLIYGVKLAEEAQILYGNGVSPNLIGIMPNAQTYSWSDGEVDAHGNPDTKLDCIRRAMTRARIAQYPVTGVILHPNDWEDIELLKGSDAHYIWISVTEGGITRLFRTPVVETTAINEGEALTGAFGLGSMLWDREDANVRVAEQHEDFFIKNLVVLLAELRVVQTIFRPQAFVNITFDSAPVGS